MNNAVNNSEKQEIITLADNDYGIAYQSAKINFPEYKKLEARVGAINIQYTQYDVTTENFKSAKETRAQLNKLKKALNDKKIAIVKDVDQPVNQFKSQIKSLTDQIDEAATHISNQINTYEENAKKQREVKLRAEIDKWCQAAGVDPAEIIFNPKWLNKTASFTATENEVAQQINALQQQQQQLAENIKVVTAKAEQLRLPYQHWVEMLNNEPLSNVLLEMDNYAEDVKKAAERDKKAKTEANKNIVEQNGKAIDKSTGEIKEDYHTALLVTRATKIKLGGTQYQFNQLMKYLKDMGFKLERVQG